MRRILLATAALALCAGSAMAAGDSATINVTAEQEEVCNILVANDVVLGAVGVDVPGTFQYTCNFEGSPTFTFVSLNGGVSNGTNVADYGIYLNDLPPGGGPGTWQPASTSQTPGSVYPGISLVSPANATATPEFHLGLTQPLPVAGSYSDQLTITITP